MKSVDLNLLLQLFLDFTRDNLLLHTEQMPGLRQASAGLTHSPFLQGSCRKKNHNYFGPYLNQNVMEPNTLKLRSHESDCFISNEVGPFVEDHQALGSPLLPPSSLAPLFLVLRFHILFQDGRPTITIVFCLRCRRHIYIYICGGDIN